jgi:hypothetical protein
MKRNGTKLLLLLAVGLATLAAVLAGLSFSVGDIKGASANRKGAELPTALGAMVGLPAKSLSASGIARMNLVCEQGLSGAGHMDVDSALSVVGQMAARVKSETERHLYRFKQNPGEFEHSEGFFRMVMMGVVLTEDFGVHYDPQRRIVPAESRPDDGFFVDPQMVFLSGLVGPGRQGTCSSLPVLYVAVGRQLEYPLNLVTTRGHLFVRWEGGGERFNIEATGRGVNRFEDDYYRHWPFEVSPAEAVEQGYLKSLTPAEELSVFLSTRGMCQRQSGRLAEAAESFAAASRLAPACRSYRQMTASLEALAGRRTAVTNSLSKLTKVNL